MVPPEDFDFDGSAEDAPTRRISMPRVALRFFGDEVRRHRQQHLVCPANNDLSKPQFTPPTSQARGYIIRSLIIDTINIFEVNRRECARLLLELPRWFLEGTFRGKRSIGAKSDPEVVLEHEFVLEMTLLEVIRNVYPPLQPSLTCFPHRGGLI